MIITFTDFGLSGPYLGQVRAVFAAEAPQVPVIDLFADAPAYDPMAASYLLAAYAPSLPDGSVFFCVVDPGVGGDRDPIMVAAGGRQFVGPDNGLFEGVLRQAEHAASTQGARPPKAWRIDWRPERGLSDSFHGRDLFAPVTARLANGMRVDATPTAPGDLYRPDWPDHLARVIYIDHYGNAMIGLSQEDLAETDQLDVGGKLIQHARVFSDTETGHPFWYVNSNGLVEIAVNRGRADEALGLSVGFDVTIVKA
ncbi:MAG: SAM-dependent chlorinase/fluorinase [Alphaproteobacteria bacterium]|nr:SAM-dependent chlorinase/fluorinase [Alphaproteobacteria bacterium SS10]